MPRVQRTPPVIDISAFQSNNSDARDFVVTQVREACHEFGFFQITGHGVSAELQERLLRVTKELFALPTEEKRKLNVKDDPLMKGYQGFFSQGFDSDLRGDMKESFSTDDSEVGGKFPREALVPEFRKTCMEYLEETSRVAVLLFRVIALSLDMEEGFFNNFTKGSGGKLLLLHYPPQSPMDNDNVGFGEQ